MVWGNLFSFAVDRERWQSWAQASGSPSRIGPNYTATMNAGKSILLAAALLLGGCGGGGAGDDVSAPVDTPAADADISLLFMGNSHTAANDLTGMVLEMVRAALPGTTVAAVRSPGSMFLEDRIDHEPSITLQRSQDWSFVILQAQKYSSSGQFEYSTAEAVELVRMAAEQNAVPILFPEWPRRDVNETQRIYDLHISIAQQEPACVAPIGQAWDLALERHPTLILYAQDGNHSAPTGAFLTALILFATITGADPQDLPALSQFAVEAETQALLRTVAQHTVQAWPPHAWCPEMAAQ